MRTIVAGSELAGLRLDRAVAASAGLGLRGARRMIADGMATLNERKALASARVRAGDRICLAARSQGIGHAQFLAACGDFCFFDKPAGLHTVALAGRANGSLEAELPELCAAGGVERPVRLLQRLDYGTSGIICAGLTAKGVADWQSWQALGCCRKFYLALLQGRLETPLIVKNRISQGAKKARCLSEDAPELRWTAFEPLWHGDVPGYSRITLARCEIRSGVRHQIRVHAALCGHPLAGDGLYGGDTCGAGYRLAHYRLEFPGHAFTDKDEFFDGLFARLPIAMERFRCI